MYDGPISNPIKGKGITSMIINNNPLEICHSKREQQRAKGFHEENNQCTLD